MVPARKQFDVGIAGVTLDEGLELTPLDRFQQLTEDASSLSGLVPLIW
jgi:hypothetical protein